MVSKKSTKKKSKKNKSKKASKVAEPEPLQPTLKGHTNLVNGLILTPEVLYSCGFDKSIRTWDLKLWKLKFKSTGHTGIIQCMKLSNGLLYSGALDKTVRIWDTKNGSERDQIKFKHSVFSLAVDGIYLYVGLGDCSICCYDLKAKQKELVREYLGHTKYVSAIVIKNNILFSSSWDGDVREWSIETTECLRIYKAHKDWITTMFVYPSHSRFVTGSPDNTIKVWDTETGKQTAKVDCGSMVQSLAGEGNIIFVGLQDGTIKVYDVRNGNYRYTFEGHSDAVRSLLLDNGKFFSGSKDSTIKMWNTQEMYARFVGEDTPPPAVAIPKPLK